MGGMSSAHPSAEVKFSTMEKDIHYNSKLCITYRHTIEMIVIVTCSCIHFCSTHVHLENIWTKRLTFKWLDICNKALNFHFQKTFFWSDSFDLKQRWLAGFIDIYALKWPLAFILSGKTILCSFKLSNSAILSLESAS
jgi:hypothetical protein